ncbi:MAG: hypothetical protein ABJN72_02165 [Sulfitobacter sp.]
MTEHTETPAELVAAIKTYNEELVASKELAKRLSNNVSWYFVEVDGEYLYGPSKWVGYKDLDADTYIGLTDEGELGGQLTEASLVHLRRAIAPNSSEHRSHYERLTKLLAAYGKVPNKRTRFNAVVTAEETEVEDVDKAADLVALLGAVIRTLPDSSKAHLKREFFH